MKPIFLLFVFFLTWSVVVAKRVVDCSLAEKPIDPTIKSYYSIAFTNFEDTNERNGKDSLMFETLAGFATAAHGGLDVSEGLVIANEIASLVQSSNVSIQEVIQTWRDKWESIGDTVFHEGESYLEEGDEVAAVESFKRASVMYQLAERFEDHQTAQALHLYNKSIVSFHNAMNVKNSASLVCNPLKIPFEGAHLRAYWCPSSVSGMPTILALGGYDSSAELTYYETGNMAGKYGYNVLIFEGPGQGSTVRFEGLKFRPDYETPVGAILDYMKEHGMGGEGPFVIWGRSFGGYLSPRAFLYENRLSACIADGGVNDFLQLMLCHLSSGLRSLYYNNVDEFNLYISEARKAYLSLDFMLKFGALGFEGADVPAALYESLDDYYFHDNMLSLVDGRPILVIDPEIDDVAGNQSRIFMSNLPQPWNTLTQMKDMKAMRGCGLHCAVGSTQNEPLIIMNWLLKAAPKKPGNNDDGGGGDGGSDHNIKSWVLALIVGGAFLLIAGVLVTIGWMKRSRTKRLKGKGEAVMSPLLNQGEEESTTSVE
eukprot:TRINITY_DN82804_c0_g1_i1.p1 TRINITY_DN82804_c0_g1~~TRINITY_DN82804_c0_g1_i1.p1  ORF type:complete len:574 (+),score=120.77 TRINITY_DN82804_c0_g1_i1:104-1723(+)